MSSNKKQPSRTIVPGSGTWPGATALRVYVNEAAAPACKVKLAVPFKPRFPDRAKLKSAEVVEQMFVPPPPRLAVHAGVAAAVPVPGLSELLPSPYPV